MRKFIVFEGTNGVGKTEILRRIEPWLKERYGQGGYWITQQPCGSPIGKELFDVVGESPTSSKLTLDLFEIDRRHHCKLIADCINNDRLVLCSRWIHSTYVYQGLLGECTEQEIDESIQRSVPDWLYPDVVFWLDAPVEIIAERLYTRVIKNPGGYTPDQGTLIRLAKYRQAYEIEFKRYTQKVRNGSLILRLDTNRPIENLVSIVQGVIESLELGYLAADKFGENKNEIEVERKSGHEDRIQ